MQLLNINYYITTIILLFYYSTILLHYITLFYILHLGTAAYYYNKITEDSVAPNLHRGLQILHRPILQKTLSLLQQRETQTMKRERRSFKCLVSIAASLSRRRGSESEGLVEVGCG